MKVEDVAYLAGLIDGEGTVSLIHERPGAKFRHPCVSIASTSIELLDWLGGNVRSKKTYQAHHKTSYHWDTTGQKAVKLLELVLPFMKEKKKKARAELILSQYSKLTKRNGKYKEKEIADKLAFEKLFFEL
jgi:hypothetical protein